MKQYTFVNVTKVMYGISILESLDVTFTFKQYLLSNDNVVSFESIKSMFQDPWDNQHKKLYVYDQHYVMNPCEITEQFNKKFKIVFTQGGSMIINTQGKTKDDKNENEIKKVGLVSLTYTKIKMPVNYMLKHAHNTMTRKNKLCFCFLIYDKLNKNDIWENFFSNADPSKHSVLIHSKNEIVSGKSKLIDKYLIKDRYSSEWGMWSIVHIQNRLLELGLQDPDNDKFIFMSDSHVPLHEFETVYNCIMSNDFSYIEIMGRQTQTNANKITDSFNVGKMNMFKMSQWSCINRTHALMLIENESVMKTMSENSSIPDENAYICTLTGLYYPQKINNLCNKNLTFVDWTIPSSNKMYRAHPRTYDGNELTKLLPTLRNEYLFVRKISSTCNIDDTIIQPHSLSIKSIFHTARTSFENKTIVGVYCRKTKNFSSDFRSFWGFGDMIRGTISLYKISQEFGTKFVLDFYKHPISKYFESNIHENNVKHALIKSEGNVYTFYKFADLVNYIRKMSNVSDVIVVHTNAVYKDMNNMLENTNSSFLTYADKSYLRTLFRPTAEIKMSLDEIVKSLPENYNVMHFRVGDDFFNNDIDDEYYNKLEEIFVKYTEPNDVLMTDNNNLKKRLHEKFGCIILDTDIVHVGLSDNDNGVKDTIIEWFVQINSKKIKTYSVYSWISGFVYWTHQLYDIKMINMKEN